MFQGARKKSDLVIALLTVLTLSVLIDPYMVVSSPILALATNSVLALLVGCLLFAASGRWHVSAAVVAVVLLLLRYAESVKQDVLHSSITFADIKLIPALLGSPDLVMGFVRLGVGQWLLLSALLLIMVLTLVLGLRCRAASAVQRWLAFALLLGGAFSVATIKAPFEIAPLGWMLAMQMRGAEKVGVSGNILLGFMASSQVRPVADPGKAQAFWKSPQVVAAGQEELRQGTGGASELPDIVFVQSESLFEPSALCGMPDTPFLTNLAALDGESMANLQVPVFGHLTLQTEFEVMSGFPVQFAPHSLMAYYELVDGPVNAVPRHLAGMGYRTIAIHPGLRTFWRRHMAMPALGFETFVDGDAYFRRTDYSPAGWVTDRALSESVLSALQPQGAPTFVLAISIENHGPWGSTSIADRRPVTLPESLKGAARDELHDYLVRARRADEALAYLLANLERRKRPTMVVFYGDHLPALNQTYDQLCFKNGRKPEEQLPPWRIWSNFALREMPKGRMPSYWLGAAALHAAGIDLTGTPHLRASYLASRIHSDPGVPESDRDSVRALYAHVATLGVFTRPENLLSDGRYVVGGERALARLLATQPGPDGVQPVEDGIVKEGRGGFALQSSLDAGSSAAFSLEGRAAAGVFRPWVRFDRNRCLSLPRESLPTLSIWADGTKRRQHVLDGRTVTLDLLPLDGVRSLEFQLESPEATRDCAEVAVSVSQLVCFSPACEQGGETYRSAGLGALSSHENATSLKPEDVRLLPLQTDRDRVEYMLQRMRDIKAPYAPVTLTHDDKLYLHPTVEQSASIELDVEGLSRLELEVAIQPLNEDCLAIEDAGVVSATIELDGQPIAKHQVDRDASVFQAIDVGAGRGLRVTIDAGNSVAWCDWAAVGFPLVEEGARAPE